MNLDGKTGLPAKTREGMKYGKPVMPAVPTVAGITLADFFGKDSLMFFRILNPRFLANQVEEWEDDESYLEAMVTADNLVVVNDAAERGVKLCYDFLEGTQDEQRFQHVLQVVENSRNRIPKMRKLNDEGKCRYLAVEVDD